MPEANTSQVVLTFLGPTDYETARYKWAEAPNDPKEITTHLFPLALAHWFPEAEFKVAITETVKNHSNWETLRCKFNEVRKEQKELAFEEVIIPEGRNEHEIWQLFNNISEAVLYADELIIDFTHSLRSIPLIAIMTALYVTEIGRIKGKPCVSHILYGAFELRDRKGNCPICGASIPRVPVLDFASLLRIANWLTAAHLFTKTGDAREIAKLAKEESRDVKELEEVAEKLRTFSLALELGRPRDVRENLGKLDEKAKAAKPMLSEERGPLGHILETLTDRYGNLRGAPEPASAIEELELDLKLIEWYIDAGKIAHACTLAGEWLTTWATGLLGMNYTVLGERNCARDAMLNNLRPDSQGTKQRRKYTEADADRAKTCMTQLEQRWGKKWEEWYQRWRTKYNKVAQLRNQVAHCGMARDDLTEATQMEAEVCNLPDELRAFLDGFKQLKAEQVA